MKAKDTKGQIIELADQLIRSRGFNAFSYRDIAVPIDIRPPAIHHHFPVKSDLGISVIDKELQRIARQQVDFAGLPGDQRLKKIVEGFYRSSRQGSICLTGSLTPDYETLSSPMQTSIRKMCEAILELMTGCLKKGRKDGSLHFKGSAADRALLVLSALLSSLLLARVLGEEVFDKMIDQLFSDLGTPVRVAQLEEYRPEHLE